MKSEDIIRAISFLSFGARFLTGVIEQRRAAGDIDDEKMNAAVDDMRESMDSLHAIAKEAQGKHPAAE